MPGLSAAAFDETKHSRGQPDNPGKFKARSLPVPPKATPRQATRAAPKPTLFAKVMRDSGQWSVALTGRSVGFVALGNKAEAVAWAEQYLASDGGGEITVTDRSGSSTRRYIVRATPSQQPAKVTVRHAKRGAKVVYGQDVDLDLMYGRATSHRSRDEALERARSHLVGRGGGEVEIQNPAGTVIEREVVPAPDWWMGDETTPNGSGSGPN